MFQRILVALTIEDELNEPLIRAALTLAETHQADLRFVTVMPVTPTFRASSLTQQGAGTLAAERTIHDLREAALAYQQKIKARLMPVANAGMHIEHEFREGLLDVEVVSAAEAWGANLITIGAQQRGFLDRLLHGTPDSEAIVRTAPCAVIAIPEVALTEDLSDALQSDKTGDGAPLRAVA
ncbi:MAG: universal stress protein [Pseudomonadota bacterium]